MPRETVAARRARALRIGRLLAEAYPDAACALHHRDAFQLLVATILSAQCTDKKVNEVTPALFRRFPTPAAMAEAAPSELERLIQPTGFFRQKTKSILSAAQDLVTRFGGRVPDTLDALVTLRGVGRKTANVVLGNAFDVPGLTVDTHMQRVNRRLGLTREEDPVKIERDLMQLVPEKEWTLYSHRVIHHGRACCDARRPRCETCPLRPECPWPDSVQARRRTLPVRSGRAPGAADGGRSRSAGARS
jgi:endonuclease-3